jgi:hypothetical protein
MARTLTLTDGTTSISFIVEGDTTGWILRKGGRGRQSINANLDFTSSSLADGAELRSKTYPPRVERWRLALKTTSQDNAADQIQSLYRLLRKGDLESTTQWQNEKVYAIAQATNETNTRYSRLLGWQSSSFEDIFDHPFENDAELDNFEVTFIREPFWRDNAPGSLPASPIPSVSPSRLFFDSISGVAANYSVSSDAALEGGFGGKFSVNGVGTDVSGDVTNIGALAVFVVEFQLDSDDLAMTSGDQFSVLRAISSGSLVDFRVVLQDNAGVREILLQVVDDSTANINTSFYPLTAGTNLIEVVMSHSTGPGNNDGTAELRVNSVSVETLTTIDNDLRNTEDFSIGVNAGADAGTIGDLYIDRVRWADADDDVWHRTIDFDDEFSWFANVQQTTGELTHIYNEDNSLAAFSANLVNEPDFIWWEVSGSTPAINDAIYFGADDPFFMVALLFAVAGDYTTAPLTTTEYSTGAGWSSNSSQLDSLNTVYTEGYTGEAVIKTNGSSTWAKRTVNGQNKYWLRVRISTGPATWTTSPEQGGQVVYSVNSPEVRVSDLSVDGDEPAYLLQRLLYMSAESANCARVTYGFKSRGLTSFFSRFNAGDDVPSPWTVSYGTDTAKTADPKSPGGNMANCSFATSAALANRVSFDLDDASATDWIGTYRAYIVARHNSVTDRTIQMRLNYAFNGATIQNELVKIDDTLTGTMQLYDMGLVSILPFDLLGDEEYFDLDFVTSLAFDIQLQSSATGGDTLDIIQLVLIPSDELFFDTRTSALTSQIINSPRGGIQIDAGILRQKTLKLYFNKATGKLFPYTEWITGSRLPRLEPRRDGKLFFLASSFTSSAQISKVEAPQGFSIRTYIHNLWNDLRGVE